MSNWTHVAGVVRIDAIRLPGFDELDIEKHFGKECYWDSPVSVWDDARENPDNYLPMGSEGSLSKSVWINPDLHDVSSYTVTVFGDLRDHDSPDEIIEWFKEKCKGIAVRQATITVQNEMNGTKSWTYEFEQDA